jgi:hypothetical protein
MGQPDCFECKYGGLGHPCRSADGGFDVEAAAAAMLTRARLMAADEDPDPGHIEAVDWIVDCEYELIEDHPGLIPPLIAAAINACETARDAAYLAAGLIETALVRHGPEIIASIEAMAVAHAKARYVLSGVWSQAGSVDADVWQRLGRAVGAGPHMDDDARTPGDSSPRNVLDEAAANALMADRSIVTAPVA